VTFDVTEKLFSPTTTRGEITNAMPTATTKNKTITFSKEIEQLNSEQHSLVTKALSTLRDTFHQNEAYQQTNSHLFQLLKNYQRQSELLIPVLSTLQVLLSVNENANDWSVKHGTDFVTIVFEIVFGVNNFNNENHSTKCKVLAANALICTAQVNDEIRVLMREMRGLKPILQMTKSSEPEMSRCATNMLEVFSLNEMNRTCVPQLNGIETVLSVMQQKDVTIIKSVVGVLHSLMNNHSRNTQIIAEKCPVKPLWNYIDKSLKDSCVISELSHTIEKILDIVRAISEVEERVGDVLTEGGNTSREPNASFSTYDPLELVFSILEFFSKYQKYRHIIPPAIQLLRNVVVIDSVRDRIAELMALDHAYNVSYFSIFTAEKVNGVVYLFDKFSERTTEYVLMVLPLIQQLSKFDPSRTLKHMKGSKGIFDCIHFIKSDETDIDNKLVFAEILANLLSADATVRDLVTTELASAAFYLISMSDENTATTSKLQWAAFQLLRYFDIMKDEALVETCVSTLETKVPVYRLCDWILRLAKQHDDEQNKLLFTFLESLKNLVETEKVSGDEIANLGMTQLFVDMMDSPIFKEINLFILGTLTTNDEVKNHFVRLGGLNKLVPVLLYERDQNTISSALQISANVCERYRIAQIAFAELGGLAAVLQMLNDMDCVTPISTNNPVRYSMEHVGVKLQALTVLSTLLEHELNVSAASASGAVQIILPHCLSTSERFIQQVTSVLQQLSTVEKNKVPLSKSVELVSLLDCDSHIIQENLVNILNNVVTNDNCRRNLMTLNAIPKVKNLLESEDSDVAMLARMVLDHFKDPTSSTLKQKLSQVLAEIHADFDQKKTEIEKKFAGPMAKMLSRSSFVASAATSPSALTIEINWNFFDNLQNDDKKRSALHLFKREMWSNLRSSIEGFCDQTAHHGQALKYAVKKIVVQFADASYIQYEPENTDARVPYNGILYYNVGVEAGYIIPVAECIRLLNSQFSEVVKKMKRQSTIDPQDTEHLLSTPRKRSITESHRNPIPVLKNLSIDVASGSVQLAALKILISNPPYIQLAIENQSIKHMKKLVTKINEDLIKVYRGIKINSTGLKQERFLLITDQCLHTVKYDVSKNDIDRKHCHSINLADIQAIDLGTFDKHTEESYLAIYSKEKTNLHGVTQPATTTKSTRNNSFDDNEEPLSPVSLLRGVVPASMNTADVNPRDNCILNLIIPPYNCDRKMQFILLREIAWVLYAASSQAKGETITEPLEGQSMNKPSSGKMRAFIYNKFKIGAL
jgi:hypothetical protein